jgi:hypothetical protein
MWNEMIYICKSNLLWCGKLRGLQQIDIDDVSFWIENHRTFTTMCYLRTRSKSLHTLMRCVVLLFNFLSKLISSYLTTPQHQQLQPHMSFTVSHVVGENEKQLFTLSYFLDRRSSFYNLILLPINPLYRCWRNRKQVLCYVKKDSKDQLQ